MKVSENFDDPIYGRLLHPIDGVSFRDVKKHVFVVIDSFRKSKIDRCCTDFCANVGIVLEDHTQPLVARLQRHSKQIEEGGIKDELTFQCPPARRCHFAGRIVSNES